MVEDPIQGWLPAQPGAMVESIYQIPQGDTSKDPTTWENQIFIPHPNTMPILDIATLESLLGKPGAWLADVIRKTPLAPRKAQLDYIMSKNETNPYTHPIAHIEYFAGANGNSGVYGTLNDKYCQSDYFREKNAKGGDYASFLRRYCELIENRLELMAKYKPEILASEVKAEDTLISSRVGPAMQPNGKLANLK